MAKAKKRTKNKVVVNFVLDETSSMWGVREATINGYNKYLTKLQSDEKVNFLFSLTKFNSEKIDTVYSCVPIRKVDGLTPSTYNPSAMTPLYDAIGRTVLDTEKRLKEIRGKPSVLCVIQTDGEENCSLEFSLEKIRSLIAEKELDGWTFVYLGANQNAWESGETLGINISNTASYDNTNIGSDAVFDSLAQSTSTYTSSVETSATTSKPVRSKSFFKKDGAKLDLRKD